MALGFHPNMLVYNCSACLYISHTQFAIIQHCKRLATIINTVYNVKLREYSFISLAQSFPESKAPSIDAKYR